MFGQWLHYSGVFIRLESENKHDINITFCLSESVMQWYKQTKKDQNEEQHILANDHSSHGGGELNIVRAGALSGGQISNDGK